MIFLNIFTSTLEKFLGKFTNLVETETGTEVTIAGEFQIIRIPNDIFLLKERGIQKTKIIPCRKTNDSRSFIYLFIYSIFGLISKLKRQKIKPPVSTRSHPLVK